MGKMTEDMRPDGTPDFPLPGPLYFYFFEACGLLGDGTRTSPRVHASAFAWQGDSRKEARRLANFLIWRVEAHLGCRVVEG